MFSPWNYPWITLDFSKYQVKFSQPWGNVEIVLLSGDNQHFYPRIKIVQTARLYRKNPVFWFLWDKLAFNLNNKRFHSCCNLIRLTEMWHTLKNGRHGWITSSLSGSFQASSIKPAGFFPIQRVPLYRQWRAVQEHVLLMREPLSILKKRLRSGLLAPCVSVAPERGPKVMPLHGIVLMTHPILWTMFSYLLCMFCFCMFSFCLFVNICVYAWTVTGC